MTYCNQLHFFEAVCRRHGRRDHDRRYGTSFVKTLRELVKARHNMTAAAERLSIHRTTLIRRLEKMQDLAPVDFENPREYFHLAVSLEL